MKIATECNNGTVNKEVPPDREKQMASYSDPNLLLVPDFLAGVVEFVRKVGK